MSAGVGIEFIGLADIENIEIAFRISLLSMIEREMQVLPVWQPPFCVSGLCRCRTMSAGVGLEFIGLGDLENIGIAVEFRSYLFCNLSYQYFRFGKLAGYFHFRCGKAGSLNG
jgi:hypothetical protein